MITFRSPLTLTRDEWISALQALAPTASVYSGEKPPPPNGCGSYEDRRHWDDPDCAIWIRSGRRIVRALWRTDSPESVAGCLLSPDGESFPVGKMEE